MRTVPELQSLMAEDTIFITPTGSRLYGLENAESDYDFTIVSAGRKISTSTVTEHFDLRRVDFLSFTRMLEDNPGGTLLESLYSEEKALGPLAEQYMPHLEAIVPSASRLRANMLKVAIGPLKKDLYKRVRFGAYTASRWNQWYWGGKKRYNPTLTEGEKQALNRLADQMMPMDYEERKRFLRDELFFLDLEQARELFDLNLNL